MEGNPNKDHSKQETYRFNPVLNPFFLSVLLFLAFSSTEGTDST